MGFCPCWDLEETEGYEVYRQELADYSTEMKRQWADKYQAKLEAKAVEIGVPGNTKLAEYILGLEAKISKLFELIDSFE